MLLLILCRQLVVMYNSSSPRMVCSCRQRQRDADIQHWHPLHPRRGGSQQQSHYINNCTANDYFWAMVTITCAST